MPGAGNTTLCAWGDSFTAGWGASAPQHSYPARLARLLRRPVANHGVSGQTSRAIAARQGSVPARLRFARDTLLPGTANRVHAEVPPLTQWSPPGGLHGSVLGVAGLLDGDEAALRFTPAGLAAPLRLPPETPFIPDAESQRDAVNLLWLGRNNAFDAEQVLADTAAAIAHVRSGRVVVLSVLNSAGEVRGTPQHEALLQLNRRLAALPGAVYLDLRSLLVAAGEGHERALDIPAAALRADELHLNDAGYELAAQALARTLGEQNW